MFVNFIVTRLNFDFCFQIMSDLQISVMGVNNSSSSTPPNMGSMNAVGLSCALVFLMAMGLSGNMCVTGVYLVSKQLRTPSNLFIVSLALADSMTLSGLYY